MNPAAYLQAEETGKDTPLILGRVSDSDDWSMCSLVETRGFPELLIRHLFRGTVAGGPETRYFWTLLHEGTNIWAVFVPPAVLIWDPTNGSMLADISVGLVEKRHACFIESSQGLGLAIHIGRDELVVIPDLRTPVPKSYQFADIRCFEGFENRVLVLTNDRILYTLDIEDGSIVESARIRFAVNPFRQPHICDSQLMKRWQNCLFCACYSFLLVFDSNLEKLHALRTGIGKPVWLDFVEDRLYLVGVGREGTTVMRVVIAANGTLMGDGTRLVPSQDVSGFVALDSSMFCLGDLSHICVLGFDSAFYDPFSYRISESAEDVVLGLGRGPGERQVTVLTLRNGLSVLEVKSAGEMKAKVDGKMLTVNKCFELWQKGSFHDSLTLAKETEIEEGDLARFDVRILSLRSDLTTWKVNMRGRLEEHEFFVEMANAILEAPNKMLIVNACTAVALLVTYECCVESGAASLQALAEPLLTGDLNLIGELVSDDLICDLAGLIVERCIQYYESRAKLYGTLMLPDGVVRMLVRALESFDTEHVDEPCLEKYAKVCSFGFQFLNDISLAVEAARKLMEVSVEHCERIALQHGICPLLGDIIHRTQEFDRCERYATVLDEPAMKDTLDYMKSQGWLSDVLQIGSIPALRPAVSEVVGQDSWLLALHYLSDNDAELGKSAELLLRNTKENSYDLDQSLTVLSIAKLCCRAGDASKELFREIENRLQILELQKKAGLGGDAVIEPDELIHIFVDRKDISAALCVYAASTMDRDVLSNGRVLAGILSSIVREIIDDAAGIHIDALLTSSGAAFSIPESLENCLAEVVPNAYRRGVIMEHIRAAHAALCRSL